MQVNSFYFTMITFVKSCINLRAIFINMGNIVKNWVKKLIFFEKTSFIVYDNRDKFIYMGDFYGAAFCF